MVNIILAFVTGLTTGGLSCLAVQGGLLASSLAGQIEKDFQAPAASKAGRKRRGAQNAPRENAGKILAQPILAFLSAKLLAYTLLGFLLGLAGQMFQLSPYARAGLQIAIGIFMLGSALRMLNVHPIFRYFAFEPPAFLRRKLRRMGTKANGDSLSTPIFMGLLTVLIPCGVTQAMMAAALGTGSPAEGAAMMFAFTLGASPVFFAVAYFATRLGAKLEKHFTRFVAAVVLLLAVVTIDSGVTLAGSPVSLTRLVSGAFAKPQEVVAAPETLNLPTFEPEPAGPEAPAAAAPELESEGTESSAGAAVGGEQVIRINVVNYGYEPSVVHAKAGVPVKLALVSDNVYSCALAFYIPALNLQQLLEPTGETVLEIPPQEAGTQMPFSCSMGMYGGTIIFDL